MKTEQRWKIGDCLDLLPEIPDKSVDMILTDLPYGVTDCSWDILIDINLLWKEYERICVGNILLFGQEPFSSFLRMSKKNLFVYDWIWIKEKGVGFTTAKFKPMIRTEIISVFQIQNRYWPIMEKLEKPYTHALPKYGSKSQKYGIKTLNKSEREYKIYTHRFPTNILFFARENNRAALHPTQKPLALIEYLIKTYTNEGDLVHDSCLGSGTTLEACMNLNRNCIGFEIDPQWEQTYRKRLCLDDIKLDTFAGVEEK